MQILLVTSCLLLLLLHPLSLLLYRTFHFQTSHIQIAGSKPHFENSVHASINADWVSIAISFKSSDPSSQTLYRCRHSQ
ncbi:hypothetical protein K456DRAFT_54819 [Colletotrichum gloeosporioides 23]|nr:hypothetical protein K456DRAFT_54819 [Colletotrichum gloeosporioides 23]